MERITIQQRNLAKAFKRLNNMIMHYHEKKSELSIEEEDFLAYQDSVVKRFEICFDLLWKLLKEVLSDPSILSSNDENSGRAWSRITAPKTVLHEAFVQGLLNQQEVDIFLKMCDDRNLCSHTYDEEHSQKVAERVIEYYHMINPAISRIIGQEQ